MVSSMHQTLTATLAPFSQAFKAHSHSLSAHQRLKQLIFHMLWNEGFGTSFFQAKNGHDCVPRLGVPVYVVMDPDWPAKDTLAVHCTMNLLER